MKFRNGFVTNSSSSSFICQICGDVQSGWDMSFDEAGFVECENGHEFCVSHLINLPDGMEEYEFAYHSEVDCYEIPAIHCPICQMQELCDSDLINYVAIKGLTRKKILQDIRDSFRTYEDFREFLKTFSEGELYHEGTV